MKPDNKELKSESWFEVPGVLEWHNFFLIVCILSGMKEVDLIRRKQLLGKQSCIFNTKSRR